MSKPFFSIITCTYNSGQTIAANILSVKNQTDNDFEQIFVDGNSNDNTLEIINQSAINAKIIQAPPKGIGNAFNLGVLAAQGDWLLFLNSDDKLNNQHVLENVRAFITTHKARWYYGQAKYVGDFAGKNNIYPQKFYHRHFCYPLLFLINFINHQAVFLQRELFTEYGLYREDLKGAMDYEYWFRIGKREKPKYMPILVSDFRIGGFSSDPKNKELNMAEALKVRSWYTRFPKLSFLPVNIYRKLMRIK